ncbi:MAG: hypothetical protein ABIS14_12120 [Sphingomonas sp.]
MPKYAIALLLGSTLAAPLHATSDAATRFGAREDIEQISLSPDGTKVAYIEPSGARGAVVVVADAITGKSKPIARSSGEPDRLKYCRWSTDTRLVCGIYLIEDGPGRTVGFTRLIALDADGKNLKMLSAHDSSNALQTVYNGGAVIDWLGDDAGGNVLMTRNFVPEMSTGTHLASALDGFGVERVDTVSLKRSLVETPAITAAEYITDGHGIVRVMGLQPKDGAGYDKTAINYVYRTPNKRNWQPLGTLRLDGGNEAGFNPFAVDRDKNLVYGFDDHQGRAALYSIALDGSLKRELVVARPDVDIDTLVRIGRQQRVVGVGFATERRQTEFFDPELRN